MTETENTGIEDLARQIQDTYGIDNHGAALCVVQVYIDQIADDPDPDLYNETTRTLTPKGVEVILTAVQESIAQDIFSHANLALLDAIDDVVKEIEERTHSRDSLIRAALQTEIPRARIADAAGLSEARLYQIRDGRR